MVQRHTKSQHAIPDPLKGALRISHNGRCSAPTPLTPELLPETTDAPVKRSNRPSHVFSLRRSGSQWPKVVIETISQTDIDRFLANFPAHGTQTLNVAAPELRYGFVNSLLFVPNGASTKLPVYDAWSIRVELDMAVGWFKEFVESRWGTALDGDAVYKAHYFGLLAQRLHTEDGTLAQFCLATKSAILCRPRARRGLIPTDRYCSLDTSTTQKNVPRTQWKRSHLLLSQNILKGLVRAYMAWQEKYDFDLLGDNYINDEDDSEDEVTWDTIEDDTYSNDTSVPNDEITSRSCLRL